MTPITDAEISEIAHMDLCRMSIETAFVVERQLRRIIARMREAEKPAEYVPLPTSEGWWWELVNGNWVPHYIPAGHGKRYYASQEQPKKVWGVVELSCVHPVNEQLYNPGKWLPCPTPPVPQQCDHQWVSAVNKVVTSGEVCLKCHALRCDDGRIILAVPEASDRTTE